MNKTWYFIDENVINHNKSSQLNRIYCDKKPLNNGNRGKRQQNKTITATTKTKPHKKRNQKKQCIYMYGLQFEVSDKPHLSSTKIKTRLNCHVPIVGPPIKQFNQAQSLFILAMFHISHPSSDILSAFYNYTPIKRVLLCLRLPI